MEKTLLTKCINFDMCKNIHPTGIRLRLDGWGLQGEMGKGYTAICPVCLERARKKRENESKSDINISEHAHLS